MLHHGCLRERPAMSSGFALVLRHYQSRIWGSRAFSSMPRHALRIITARSLSRMAAAKGQNPPTSTRQRVRVAARTNHHPSKRFRTPLLKLRSLVPTMRQAITTMVREFGIHLEFLELDAVGLSGIRLHIALHSGYLSGCWTLAGLEIRLRFVWSFACSSVVAHFKRVLPRRRIQQPQSAPVLRSRGHTAGFRKMPKGV